MRWDVMAPFGWVFPLCGRPSFLLKAFTNTITSSNTTLLHIACVPMAPLATKGWLIFRLSKERNLCKQILLFARVEMLEQARRMSSRCGQVSPRDRWVCRPGWSLGALSIYKPPSYLLNSLIIRICSQMLHLFFKMRSQVSDNVFTVTYPI